MSTSDDNHERREVSVPRDRVFGLRRGGRLGIKVISYTEEQGYGDQALVFFGGLAIALAGWQLPGMPTYAMLFLGGLMMGLSIERTRWLREADPVEDGDSE